MGETPTTISHPVKAIREAKGLTQWALAALAGTSSNLIIKVEQGYVPKFTSQIKIAKALMVSRQTLWPDEEEDWLSATGDRPT
jgi:DNA-binding XRE family transcriptional regulator